METNEDFDAELKSLHQKRLKIVAKADHVRAILSTLDTDLRKIEGAIKSLQDAPVPVEQTVKKKRKVNKHAPKKQHVVDAMFAVLTDNDVLSEKELRELVEGRITRAGMSRNGFAMRFNEALSENSFVIDEGQVRLAKPKEPVVAA